MLQMASDASAQGFGACFGNQWIQAPYPPHWLKYHITVLELYPIYVMIALFGNQLLNTNVNFKTDNSAVKDIINSQTSKNKHVMKIVRNLVLVLIKYNINLRAEHIPGIINVLPDSISRFKVSTTMLQTHGMQLLPTPIPRPLLPENSNIL